MSTNPKTCLVLDTNFIIQNKKLQEVIKGLRDSHTIIVAQVSIDERIGQQSRELKKKYEDIANLRVKYDGIAKIEEIASYEQSADALKKRVQTAYTKTFGANIIPFDKGEETFATILHRANHKIPPFIESTSDKGFKDALIWLSMLEYFKANGTDEVIFITDDNGFRDNAEFLCDEFKTVTGKTVQIKPNAYYKELLPKEELPAPVKREPLPDFTALRDEIQNTIANLRWVPHEDRWGDIEWNKTYNISATVDARYMEVVFDGLENTVNKYILNKTLPASTILELDIRVTDFEEIPISAIEDCLKLYQRILSDYPEYVQQFYEACANVVNDSYVAPSTAPDDGLPF